MGSPRFVQKARSTSTFTFMLHCGILGSDWTKWSGAWPCSWGRVRSRCPVQMPATTIEIQVLPINISQEEHLLQAEFHLKDVGMLT
ncbi:unnamed protein product, partial [Effrenium voratum]